MHRRGDSGERRSTAKVGFNDAMHVGPVDGPARVHERDEAIDDTSARSAAQCRKLDDPVAPLWREPRRFEVHDDVVAGAEAIHAVIHRIPSVYAP